MKFLGQVNLYIHKAEERLPRAERGRDTNRIGKKELLRMTRTAVKSDCSDGYTTVYMNQKPFNCAPLMCELFWIELYLDNFKFF